MSSDAERTAREYDAMAVEYAADNAGGAYNAFYERPATISLLGDVQGCHVLDAGCGSGELTRFLFFRRRSRATAEQGPVR